VDCFFVRATTRFLQESNMNFSYEIRQLTLVELEQRIEFGCCGGGGNGGDGPPEIPPVGPGPCGGEICGGGDSTAPE